MKKILLFLVFLLTMQMPLLAQVDNYCLRFSTEEGVVNCGRISALKRNVPYTLQMWICPSEWKGGAALLRSGEYSIRLGNDRSILLNDGRAFFYATSDNLVADRWTHITVRTSKTQTRVWINNSLAATFPLALVLPCDENSVWLGGGYKGRMDEVRIWRGELAEDYDSFWRNTLNEFNPSWGYLLAYWKMDQEQCPNLVDYRASHHGVFSSKGVKKEKVTDNDKFKYLRTLAYGNVERYFDRMVDHQHYQLANCVSIIGARVNTNTAHAYYDVPLNNATLTGGAEQLGKHLTRSGVLNLPSRGACLTLPAGILDGQENYTFETWLYLDEWTEGGYIYRAEAKDSQKGVSLRLGPEEEGSLILRSDGKEFRYRDVLKTRKWTHIGFTPAGGASTPAQQFHLSINGVSKKPKAEDAPTEKCSTQMPTLNAVSTVGEGLIGKLDDTMLFTACRTSFGEDSHTPPFPSEERSINPEERHAMLACYTYDLKSRPELDFFSVPGFIMKMRENVAGMRGVRFVLSVAASDFDACLANDNTRLQIADDIAALANDPAFDGVDLDFEWTYTPWGWRYYARLCENLYYRLSPGKTISVSPHKATHGFPTDLMWTVDYFNFQVYDSPELATTSGFTYAHTLFENAGFPKDKIMMSYATTSTAGYVAGKAQMAQYPPRAYRYMYPGEALYDPTLNYMIGNDGEKYWLASYNEVEWRSRYVRETDLAGIMYWDMGGDLPATSKHSYARASSYHISSNVEALVTSVKTSNVAPEADPYGPSPVPSPDDLSRKYLATLSEVSPCMAYNVVNAHGLGLLCTREATDNLWLGSSTHANFQSWENPDAPAAAWLLLHYDEKWYLYNLLRKKFVEVTRFATTSQSARLVSEAIPIEVERIGPSPTNPQASLFSFRTYPDDESAYMCASPQLAEKPVCQWTRDDKGSQWMLTTCPYISVLPYVDEAIQKIAPHYLEGLSPDTSKADQVKEVIYDLQGRIVTPTMSLYTSPWERQQRGLFIQCGRKILR